MVYYRSWWAFYVCGVLRRAFQRSFRNKAHLHAVTQGATDGAIARYYKPREWCETTQGLFEIEAMQVCGLKVEVLPLPHGRLKQTLESLLPNGLARFMTQKLRMGTFLIANMRRARRGSSAEGQGGGPCEAVLVPINPDPDGRHDIAVASTAASARRIGMPERIG
jgi:hypothetical protein